MWKLWRKPDRQKREKVRSSLSFLGHLQRNDPSFSEDEWAAVQVMREVLLQINKSVSETPSGGSFNLKKRVMNAKRQ